jgi:peptidoglycan-associated lipoprotein
MDRKARIALACLLVATATAATAQLRLPRLPVIVPLGNSQPDPAYPGPATQGPPPQSALLAAAGSDTVFFSQRGWAIDANAIAALTAQARWLVANPFVTVRLEGHGDAYDSRDYALAIGDRRANAVRDFLVLQGVAPNRITVISWGKERPGRVRVGPSIVTVGPRVVTIVQ